MDASSAILCIFTLFLSLEGSPIALRPLVNQPRKLAWESKSKKLALN